MKVSLKWLQTYFDTPLPTKEAVAEAFTFHAFEIDEIQGDMMDVKVLPNRAADCLSHCGIAKELSAILDMPLSRDPLKESLDESMDIVSPYLKVEIEDPKKCLRYMGALVKGVTIGPSPTWLKEALEAVGQRSINNIVDATNYVMLNIGQPLHAFDATKLMQKDGTYAISVRTAHEREKITTLSNEEYVLPTSVLLITDANAGAAIGIAGVKGGNVAEISTETTDIIIESANFDGTTVRRGAQALKLFTEASVRFQNRPSPELVAYGMREVLALIKDIAGGDVVGVVDEYPTRPSITPVVVSLGRINGLLGSDFMMTDVTDVFRRLGLESRIENDEFSVVAPYERTDLVIAEDLVEEVGRIIGYDKISGVALPPRDATLGQARFRGIERMKDQLVEQGFIEVSTQSFASRGDITLANPLDKHMPALRTNLKDNLDLALVRAKQYAALVLAPKQKPKLFEIGTVFPKEGEFVELRMTERVLEWGESVGTFDNLSVAKLEEYGKDYPPIRYELTAYRPFSPYPFIARDIALWVPAGTDEEPIQSLIQERAGELLARLDQFDSFEKEGRMSYAFRLVFQSLERTLTDTEVNVSVANITAALIEKGYAVR